MNLKREQSLLRAGKSLGVRVIIPESPEDEVPAVMTWHESGATLELIDSPETWPTSLDANSFTVFGWTAEGNPFSLHRVLVRRVALGDQLQKVSSGTLCWDDHCFPDDKWTKVSFTTVNQAEWWFQGTRSHGDDWEAYRRGEREYHWTPTDKLNVKVAGGDLSFSQGFAEKTELSSVTVRPNASLTVTASRPSTMDRLHLDFGIPLLALVAFAADAPDELAAESYSRDFGDERRRIEVWRGGRGSIQPASRRTFLFLAEDLHDPARSIKRWWSVNRKVRPALGIFGDHLNMGTTYSPGRLLTLVTAMEAYGRVRHSNPDFKALRKYGQVSPEITKCTNRALDLLGATRGYLAHLETNAKRFSIQEIEDSVFDSTRRGSALMQSCLLREVGFRRADSERILSAHYSNWPLPAATVSR